jgi:hypothetical protein
MWVQPIIFCLQSALYFDTGVEKETRKNAPPQTTPSLKTQAQVSRICKPQEYCKSVFSKANITRAIKYYEEEILGQPYEPMVILSGELESKSENTLIVTEYDHATLNMEQCKDIKAKLGYTCYAAVVV